MAFSGYTDWAKSDNYWGGSTSSKNDNTLGRMFARVAWDAVPNTSARNVKFTFKLQMVHVYSNNVSTGSPLNRGNMAATIKNSTTYVKVNGTNLYSSSQTLKLNWGYKYNIGTRSGSTYKINNDAAVRVDPWGTSKTKTVSAESDGSVKIKVEFKIFAPNIYQEHLGYNKDITIKFSKTITIPASKTGIPPLAGPSTPGNQRVNGSTSAIVLQKDDDITITWSKASGGTYGVEGYCIYWYEDGEWLLLDTVEPDVTSYTTRLSEFYNSLKRGESVRLQVTTYNYHYESPLKSGESDTLRVTLDQFRFSVYISPSRTTTTTAIVEWESNLPVSFINYWIGDDESNWRSASIITYSTGGEFTITGLPVGATIPVHFIARSKDDYLAEAAHLVFMKKIAVFTYVPSSWRIEDSLTVTISNPGGCSMNLYLAYNGIEIIGRSNITLDSDGDYTLTLSSSEKETLYSLTGSNPNPTFTLILKSYQNSVKVGEDTRTIGGTLDTHAWVKVGSTWRKAKVWVKPGSTWRVATPWVKVGSGWRRS